MIAEHNLKSRYSTPWVKEPHLVLVKSRHVCYPVLNGSTWFSVDYSHCLWLYVTHLELIPYVIFPVFLLYQSFITTWRNTLPVRQVIRKQELASWESSCMATRYMFIGRFLCTWLNSYLTISFWHVHKILHLLFIFIPQATRFWSTVSRLSPRAEERDPSISWLCWTFSGIIGARNCFNYSN